MTKEKGEKLTLSIVALAVATLVLFLSIAIYQGIRIGVRKRKLNRLENEIERLIQEKQDYEGSIEDWLSDDMIKARAYELGLIEKYSK